MTLHPSSATPLRRHRRAGLVAAVLAVTATALALAPRANGGTYAAIQCHEPLGAGRADARFERNSGRYIPSADCSGAGLGVEHDPGRRERTTSGRFGAWTLTAPAATTIVRAAARVTAAARDGHVPQLFATLAGGGRRFVPGVRGERQAVSWSGAARSLTGRLTCGRRTCGPGDAAHIHLSRVALKLRDSATPSLALSGPLLAPGARRGVQGLHVDARDQGAGVRAIAVEVNGDPLPARVFRCELRSGFALRLRPCATAEDAWFSLDTNARFRQGPNHIRVCATDHAYRSEPNRACMARTVRVDNLCPLSTEPGARLDAHFRGGRTTLTTRSDRSAVVAGRLRDAEGVPVAGARVCVATRAGSAAERVIATPFTNDRGEFTTRIPGGPSRTVRIAHWPNAGRALEENLTLRSRAVPRLRLHPDRTLANGEELRFEVRLPGPANGRRTTFVQARAGERWIRVAGGKTRTSGVWRGSYRFRSTTGTRRYAFRAVVPKQAGYPYEPGRSQIAHKTVTG